MRADPLHLEADSKGLESGARLVCPRFAGRLAARCEAQRAASVYESRRRAAKRLQSCREGDDVQQAVAWALRRPVLCCKMSVQVWVSGWVGHCWRLRAARGKAFYLSCCLAHRRPGKDPTETCLFGVWGVLALAAAQRRDAWHALRV